MTRSHENGRKRRLVSGLLMIAGSSVVAFGSYVLGIMFLSFAGGATAGPHIPVWFELTMLLVWPIALALSALIPGTLMLAGSDWKWPTRIGVGGFIVCLLWWFAAMALMISYSQFD